MDVEEKEDVREEEAGEDQDTVDVENLDDDELDKMIEGDDEEEDNGDAGAEDDSEEAGEETDEGDKGTEEEPPESEAEALRRQLQEKESFIQRQANEIGELRKQPPLEDDIAPREEEIGEDAYFDNPSEAVAKTVDRVLAEREQRQVDEIERIRQYGEASKEMVTKVIPHFAELIDDITTIAKEDGYTEENLRAFKADPFTSSDPNILISYAKRAEMRKELAEYKQRVAELEKEPENVVRRIQEAGKRSATLTGRTTPSAGGKQGSDVSVSQISSMSDAELDEALNNA